MQKGNIGVTTENIFPVIKKFLYSDHEIFLRELVSNAVDATQKLKTLASIGEFKGEVGDLTVHVSLGKDTITVSDRGIGLTAEEIDKYINQIAFSGANDFLEKYKNDANAIIGHFGLGFYSAFMVAKKVEIITKSHILYFISLQMPDKMPFNVFGKAFVLGSHFLHLTFTEHSLPGAISFFYRFIGVKFGNSYQSHPFR